MSDHAFRCAPRGRVYTPLGRIFGLLIVLCSIACVGCVERRMTIRTNADNDGGALAVLDNREIGQTPCSTGITYYADREIKLIKDGRETTTVIQPIKAPWYEWPIFEFVSENIVPWTIRDDREFYYELPPPAGVTTDELLDRAHKFRQDGQSAGEVVPRGRTAAAAEPKPKF